MFTKIKNKAISYVIDRQIDTAPGPSFFSGPSFYWNKNLKIGYQTPKGYKYIIASPISPFAGCIVDSASGLLIFTTPKVASTTLKNYAYKVLKLGGELDMEMGGLAIHKKAPVNNLLRAKANKKFLKHEVIDYTAISDGHRSYLIMRSPYSKLVSFFQDKFIRAIDNLENLDHKTFNNPLIFQVLALIQRHSPLAEGPSLENLTFEALIMGLHKSFKTQKDRVWERHLTAQITPDFAEVALDTCTLVDISQTNDFINYWHYQHYGVPKERPMENLNRSHSRQKAVFLEDAWSLPLIEVLKLNYELTPQSFYNPALESLVNEIYSLDYKYWSNIKPINFKS